MERLITLLLLLLFSGCSLPAFFDSGEISPAPEVAPLQEATSEIIDMSLFIQRAENASCSDRLNAMYLIDGQYVIWYLQGDCADASYSTTLFDAQSGDALCSAYDSIAGPVTDCTDESARSLFDTLAATQRPDTLEEHTVEEIYSAGGGIRGRQ
jgi:hypothetical protein